MSIGAGVEHLLADDLLPAHVPIVRMVQPDMTQRMTEYVLQHVLAHHRRARCLADAQMRKAWLVLDQPSARERCVGILGLGRLGATAAQALTPLGFDVWGWSRTPKSIPGIQSETGSAGLETVLKKAEILVCLLPLTAETTGLLNADTLRLLPPGASVINAARGPIIVDGDLLAVIDQSHIREATLDAFSVEPLPQDHPFWTHPKITVTPHNASAVTRDALAYRLIAVVETVRSGLRPEPVVDRTRGY
ncbi:MAG: glyoxylate/hydroxypyruvate reductase A [Pseudomonadota bacterium]